MCDPVMKCLPLSVQTTYEPMLTRFFYVVSFWLPRLVEWENSTVHAHRAKKRGETSRAKKKETHRNRPNSSQSLVAAALRPPTPLHAI